MENPRKNVLVVEDDLDLGHKLAEFLQRGGLSLEHVGTITEAIDRLPDIQPEIVLVDYMLPDGLGTKIERFIRSHPNLYNRCSIVYQTAVNDEDDLVQLNRHQAHVLVKPFKAQELLAKINAAKEELQILNSKSDLGLLGLEMFKRELDYRFLRKELTEAVVFAPLIDIDLTLLVKNIKSTMQNRGFSESTIFDLGKGPLGAILIEKDHSSIITGLCEIYQKKPEELESTLLLSSIKLADVDVADFDLTKVVHEISMASKPNDIKLSRPAPPRRKGQEANWQG
jgi:CheY-like chemotaxis protein